MCGIIGYISKNKEGAEIAKQAITPLLLQSETRGSDATGIGFIDNNELYVIKKDIPADKFTKNSTYKTAIKNHTPLVMIGHTRLATLGVKTDNNNNHPIYTKLGKSIVHNGVITNHSELFTKYKIDRDGLVDSEIIIKLIEYFITKKKLTTKGSITKMASLVRGSMTIAYIDGDYPNTLHLLASSNPLALAYEIKTGNIYFASKLEYLKTSLLNHRLFGGYFWKCSNRKNYIFQEVKDNTLLSISNGVIKVSEIERPDILSGYDWCRRPYTQGSQPTQKLLPSILTPPKKKEVDNFDPRSPIKKPSIYSDGQLEDRLDQVEYQITLDNKNPKLIEEKRRLENTLYGRYTKYEDYQL